MAAITPCKVGLFVALLLITASGCGSGPSGAPAKDSAALRQPAATAAPDFGNVQDTPVIASPATATPGDVGSSDSPSETQTPLPTLTPPPTQPASATPVSVSSCQSVQHESHYCLTMSDGDLRLLGLDSGRFCPITSTDAPVGGFLVSGSIAWLDEHVYVCGQSGLIRISLADGSWDEAGAACDAVASYDGGLLVNRWLAGLVGSGQEPTFGPPLSWYADFDAVRRNEPGRTFTLGSFSETMTVQGSTLYTAWHAGISIDLGDLEEDRPLGVLTLEGFDGWMLGMSVTEDRYLVLLGDDGVLVFDAYTGQRVQRLDADVSALACVAGPITLRATPTTTVTPTPNLSVTPTPTPCASFDCRDACADLASDPSPFRLYELPPSAAIESCFGGSSSSNYVLPDSLLVPGATEELHVIGVYEAAGNGGLRESSQGVIDVIVHERPKPIVLALSSYEGMLWRLSVDPGAKLSRVILQGYGPQEVEGLPEGVAIEYRAENEACGYAYGWETWNNSGGGGYESMIKSLRRSTGLVETSFQGCYTGDAFQIPFWSGQPPPIRTRTPVPGDETLPREAVAFPGCESVTAESQYCLTTTMLGGIALLGLDSGNVCPVTTAPTGIGTPFVPSLGWRGELMYACTDAGLVRISLRDGTWESAQRACDGVTDYDGGLLVESSFGDPSNGLDPPLRGYPDYAAVLSGNFSAAFTVGAFVERFTVDGHTLYSAWHSTNTIDVADLSADEARPSILLDGYDGWILGLSVVGGQLVISGDTWGDTVYVFDATTGQHLRDITPSTPVYGLSCVSRHPPTPH